MKILIANYRYFVSSGPERYLFNISDRLMAEGHTVMPFSIRYDQNEKTPYARYFVSPIGGDSEVFFEQHRKSLSAVYKGLSRLVYSREVEQAVARMVDETKPDVAYVLYYLRKLSPSVLVGIKSCDVPIVVRISDYGMFCPEHHLLRNDAPCTLCQQGSIFNSVKHRCVKGSRILSLLDATATTFHRWRGYFDLIDRFVTTNPFMTEMMVKAGFPADKLTCIPTFANLDKFTPGPAGAGKSYLLYVGRLDKPKGVHVLIDAMALLKQRGYIVPLKIAGSSHAPDYPAALRKQTDDAGLSDSIEFLGSVPAEQIPALMRGAIATIMPALWYENLPNSVVEAFASGCPVIASDLGSLSHTVTHEVDGLHFRPGDAADLADKIERLLTDSALRNRLAEGAYRKAVTRHSPADHTAKLLELFGDVTSTERHALASGNPGGRAELRVFNENAG
ncbi:glycosyltransferase family 4 protein [Dongia deserti]|uniref:glycosyltransferase family 4 protein n=1 Tax=Dongia deserti TaxID=2268030 RepID=UPI000E65D82C|nr:glycosyltransferase family 4 protein [Dongia deserti]